MRRRRATLFTILLLAGLVAACGLWLQVQRRQYALNRALIAALVEGNDRQALVLVNAGADPNTRYEPTPMPSLPQLVKQLLHRSAPPANDALTAFLIACAAYRNDEDSDEFLRRWKQPDDVSLVQAMLKQGADVNARDEKGIPALSWAARANRVDTARLLLEQGARVDARDELGLTPLLTAARCDQSELMRLLLDYKANVNAQDEQLDTPLLWAIIYRRPAIPAMITPSFEDPLTTFHPSRSLDPDTVPLLLEHGADVNVKDETSRTALYWFVMDSSPSVMDSSPSVMDSSPSTQTTQMKAIIGQLLAHGADPNLADKDGKTPLMLVQQNNRPDLVALLKQAGAREPGKRP